MSEQRTQSPLALCAYCSQKSVMTDATGRQWCAEHRYRGDLLNYGAAHGYPSVSYPPYAIMHGAYFWTVNACVAREECVKHILAGLQWSGSEDEL